MSRLTWQGCHYHEIFMGYVTDLTVSLSGIKTYVRSLHSVQDLSPIFVMHIHSAELIQRRA